MSSDVDSTTKPSPMVRSTVPVRESERDRTVFPPRSFLGLLGGGQLGRMFALAAQTLGFRVIMLDPDPEGPAVAVSDEHICAGYADPAALAQLASRARAVTTEFENVPAQSLSLLSQSIRVFPDASCVSIAQDRIAEKAFIAAAGLTPVPYVAVRDGRDFELVDDRVLPGILKAARLGYDGKGQVRVATPAEALSAYAAMGQVPCVLEKRVALAYELSVIVARDANGNVRTYPVAQNIHRDGILAVSIVPSSIIASALADRARHAALTIAERMNYIGVLCVEFFVLADGTLCVNEMAPRPHNSGHYTIDACVTSQFEQQVRILSGLPLGDTTQHSPAVMLNLLGNLWFQEGHAEAVEPPWSRVLEIDGAKLHLYGKREARIGRKMGHLTMVGETAEQALERAQLAAAILSIEAWQ